MKKLSKILTIGALTLLGTLPVKKAEAQDIEGWAEITKGVKQGNNLRLYPKLNIRSIEYSALIDVNDFYEFSKNDFSYEKLSKQAGPLKLKPVLTYHTSPFDKKTTLGANASWAKGNSFGFFEVDFHASGLEKSNLYSYNSLGTPIGNLALFTASSPRNLNSTYTEVEFNTKAKYGLNPYARVNLQKGIKPTYQFGVSINPKKLIKSFKKR